MLKHIIWLAIAVLVLLFVASYVSAATCESQADAKKLYGAARNSFVQRCITLPCEEQANERKLSGAARNSFVAKCQKDKA